MRRRSTPILGDAGDKSRLKGGKPNGSTEQLTIQEADSKPNIETGQSCPVNAIHIKDATGKKLV